MLKIISSIKKNGIQLGFSDYKIRNKDGNVIFLETYGIPLKKNNEIYAILSIAKDITFLKNINSKIQESENKLNKIYNSIPLSFHFYSLKTDGKLIFNGSNSAANKILKVDCSKFIGKTIEEAFPPLMKTDIPQKYKEIAKNGGTWKWDQIDYDDKTIKGAYEVIAFQTSPNELVASFRDITQHLKNKKKIQDSEEKLLELNKKLEETISRRTRELDDSEKLYKSLFDDSPIAIILMEMNLQFLISNAAFNKTFGYSEDDLIGKNIEEFCFCTPPSLDKFFKSIQLLKEKQLPLSFEAEIYKKDNTLAYILVRMNIINLDNLKLIELMLQDITELKESEENFKIITEQSFMGTLIIQNGKIKYVNKAVSDINEYSIKEMLNWSKYKFFQTIHPEDQAIAMDRFEKKIKGGLKGYDPFLYRLISKSGNIKWANIYSKTIQYQGKKAILTTLIDYTDKHFAEEELQKSEEKYRRLFESSKDGIAMTDLEGNILDANKAFLDMLDYSIDDLKNLNFNQIISQDINILEKSILKNEILIKNYFQEFEKNLTKKNGDTLPVNIKIWIKIDIQNNASGFWTIIRDITQRKIEENLREEFRQRLEEEVNKRTKELQESIEKQNLYQAEIIKASKFKSQFLATMSHELRTPLNAIIGFTELLLEKAFGPLNKEQNEYLLDIKTSAEHQYDMISNILNITQLESGQVILNKHFFSLNTILDQINSTIKPMYTKKKLLFLIEGLDEEKEMYADPIRFKEIFLNLLTNAIKFTIDGQIKLVIKEYFDKWIFKVRDTGIGIAHKDFNLIFKDFVRIDSTYVRSTSGTGLGLSLTKRLVELHNGTITFSSFLGVGSTFTINLPKKSEDLDVII
ncbi:MAG: PAS domain S-box protein [Candidatus Lokiarchaeota archaeon]|nr:PAS domain S-box protein [Candidatus Lokiarchaeota archaeon]